MSYDGWAALPRGATGLSAVCDCGISWSYSLTILDDLLNIDNPYFEQMVGQIYSTELQLNKANSSDTEAPFLDLTLSKTNGIVPSIFMINGMILILK